MSIPQSIFLDDRGTSVCLLSIRPYKAYRSRFMAPVISWLQVGDSSKLVIAPKLVCWKVNFFLVAMPASSPGNLGQVSGDLRRDPWKWAPCLRDLRSRKQALYSRGELIEGLYEAIDLDRQVAGNYRPLYPKVDHYWLKVAHNYEPLALQVRLL